MSRRLDQLRDFSYNNTARLDRILDTTKQIYDFVSFQQVFAKFYSSIGGNNAHQQARSPSDLASPTNNSIQQQSLLSPLVYEAEQQAKQLLKRQQTRF